MHISNVAVIYSKMEDGSAAVEAEENEKAEEPMEVNGGQDGCGDTADTGNSVDAKFKEKGVCMT